MVSVHMACSLLSYGAFLIAFISGVLFLLQERQLKQKRMGALFHHLPSLEAMDRMNFLAIGIGFGLLSIGTASGFLDVGRRLGRWWTGDPMEAMTLALWGAYAALWLIRLRATLRGHRIALLSILSFTLVLFTILGISHLMPSWHAYI